MDDIESLQTSCFQLILPSLLSFMRLFDLCETEGVSSGNDATL